MDVSGCDVRNRFDLSGLSEVTDIVLDYNPKMTELPTGFETLSKLARVTASNCGIKKVDDSITNCPELFLVDFHGNKNLTKIPSNISGMENIIAICIDDTNIGDDLLKELKNNKRSADVTIIKYSLNG